MAAKRKAPKKAKVEGRGRLEAEHLTRAELAAPEAKRLRDANKIVKLLNDVLGRFGVLRAWEREKLREARLIAANMHAGRTKREKRLPGDVGGARRNGGRR